MRPIDVVAVALIACLASGPAQAEGGTMDDAEPATTSAPIWTKAVEPPGAPPSRLVIEGPVTEAGFQPNAVGFPDAEPSPPAPSTAVMPGSNILRGLAVRVFGKEERVEHRASPTGLLMHCASGKQPAGLVLSARSFHFPRGIPVELRVEGNPSGDIGMSLVDAGTDAPAAPMSLLRSGQTALSLPIAQWSRLSPAQDIVLTCPAAAAEVLVTAIAIAVPRPPVSRGAGTWVWQPSDWIERPEAVAGLAKQGGLDRIHLQLQVEDGEVAHQPALAALVRQLRQAGVAAHAVEGDPAMVTAQGRAHALARVAAIARYQAGAHPGAKLGGLQFDIEPYLLEAYSREPAAVWTAWAESIVMLERAWGSPISVVVPFWMLGDEAGLAAIEAARGAISQVVVMAYRTAPDEIFALGEPWLAWGTARGVPIAIALENGPLPAELSRTYVRAESGPLLLSYGHGEARVTLHSHHVQATDGRLTYTLSHETRSDPSRISFMNDRRQLGDVRSRLSGLFGAWPSFDGFMLHELGIP